MTTTNSSPKQGDDSERMSDALRTDHLMDDLGSRTASGSVVSITAQVLQMVLQIGATAILARLLVPEDFGLVAMAATVTGFVNLFTDLGLSVATVQRKEIDYRTINALFYLNILVGIAVAIIAASIAPAAGWFFGRGDVTWIIIASVGPILFASAGAQHQALLRRGMRWVELRRNDVISQLCGAVVAVVLAWQLDIGYWALVAQTWVSTGLATAMAWRVVDWRPGRRADFRAANDALKFGLNLTGYKFLNYANRNTDNLLIGWYWGPGELGYYTRAYRLLLWPVNILNRPLGTVMIPAMSRVQDDPERWRKLYLTALRLLMVISAPMACLLYYLSPQLVILIFGAQWEPSIAIFQALTVAMLFQSFMNTMGWIYVSRGATDRMLRWGLVAFPPVIVGFVAGLKWGAFGVACGYSGAVAALSFPSVWYATRGTSLSVRHVFLEIFPPILIAILSLTLSIFTLNAFRLTSIEIVDKVAAYSVFYSIFLCLYILIREKFRSDVLGLLYLLRK